MIVLHVTLLALVVATTAVLLACYPGRRVATGWELAGGLVAPVLVGLASANLMNAHGSPRLEWGLPAIGVALLWRYCRSRGAYIAGSAVLGVLSVILFATFVATVMYEGYVDPGGMQRLTAVQRQRVLNTAAARLADRYPAGAILPAGDLRELLGAGADDLTVYEARAEWHTPFTRLRKLHAVPVAVWYSGGPLEEMPGRQEIR